MPRTPPPGTVLGDIPTGFTVQGIPGRTYKTERGARIAAGRLLSTLEEPAATDEPPPAPTPEPPAPSETLTYVPRF